MVLAKRHSGVKTGFLQSKGCPYTWLVFSFSLSIVIKIRKWKYSKQQFIVGFESIHAILIEYLPVRDRRKGFVNVVTCVWILRTRLNFIILCVLLQLYNLLTIVKICETVTKNDPFIKYVESDDRRCHEDA